MNNFVLGLMVLPVGFLVHNLVLSSVLIWRAVRDYGGENPKTLNWVGKIINRLFQIIQGNPPGRGSQRELASRHLS